MTSEPYNPAEHYVHERRWETNARDAEIANELLAYAIVSAAHDIPDPRLRMRRDRDDRD